ncbi:MAG: hypothetical protein MUC50_17040, partial [Myxococcota bacterium]|nr:hypothetical protein [Myxococcota bacterium]
NGTLLAEDFASIGNCSNICTDANTTYTAGTGLTLTTTEFSVNYGTTATTAAAGNHAHTGYLSSAADAVTSANIANGTILTEDFGNNAVTNAKLATDSISSAKIIDGTITGNDLALGSIASAEILDGTITSADLGTLASIRLQTEETTTRGMTADNATHWVTLSSYPATCSAANRGEIRLFRGATVLWVPDCLCLCHQGSGYAWSCLCPSM